MWANALKITIIGSLDASALLDQKTIQETKVKGRIEKERQWRNKAKEVFSLAKTLSRPLEGVCSSLLFKDGQGQTISL